MTEFKPIFIARSMEARILIGIACIAGTMILLGWLAINENARMEEFTEAYEARSIEQGAKLFEANCVACHGPAGYGLNGVGPALNSPHLFGYDFFADIDSQLVVANAQLNNATGDERIRLQARVGELEAERIALEETILYDWTDKVAELDAELEAVDAQILELEGVDSASRLPLIISQREAAELAPLLAERDDLNAKIEAATEEEAAETEEAVVEEAVEDEMADDGEAMDGEMAEDEAEAVAEGPLPGLTQEETDRFIELEAEIAAVEESLEPYYTLADTRADLVADRGAFQAVVDAQAAMEDLRTQRAEVEGQLAELGEAPEEGDDPDAEARAELVTQSAELQAALDEAEVTRQNAYDALVESGLIVHYDPSQPSRTEQVGWAGSLYDFVEGTLIGGRPTSSSYWPQPMAAWAQQGGGPLRGDQITNLVDYILNWDREFTIEDIRKVQQFARVPGVGGGGDSENAIGTTNMTLVEEGLVALADEGFVADPAAGEAAFATYGCAGCHGAQAGTGPALTGMWDRAEDNEEDRLTNTGYEGNPAGYIANSIIAPGAYVVGGYSDGIMPANFSEQMSFEDLANIVEYIRTE